MLMWGGNWRRGEFMALCVRCEFFPWVCAFALNRWLWVIWQWCHKHPTRPFLDSLDESRVKLLYIPHSECSASKFVYYASYCWFQKDITSQNIIYVSWGLSQLSHNCLDTILIKIIHSKNHISIIFFNSIFHCFRFEWHSLWWLHLAVNSLSPDT